MMSRIIKNSVGMILLMTLILGIFYPLLVTGIAQIVFKSQANGSIIINDNRATGSHLIGQDFSLPQYFQGRPSVAGPGYDASASGGSNLGATNKELYKQVAEQENKIRTENSLAQDQNIPVDLLTASASGLDPHITPAAAYLQAKRVAVSRGVSVNKVNDIIAEHIEKRQFGLLGEPRVNVLKLNLALDRELS